MCQGKAKLKITKVLLAHNIIVKVEKGCDDDVYEALCKIECYQLRAEKYGDRNTYETTKNIPSNIFLKPSITKHAAEK